jgi:hypothetical protein
MRAHPPPPYFFQAKFFDQSRHGVECASDLKCADALEVLALEE